MSPGTPPLTLTVVLVVDDDPHCRSLVSDLLKAAGFSVMTAENGPQALRALKFAIRKPSLCIIDYMMPQMNGFELIRAIRQNEEDRNTPVIMLTASNKELKESVELEGVSFLSKGSSNKEILDRVRTLLGRPPDPPKPEKSVLPGTLEIIRSYYDEDRGATKKAPAPRNGETPASEPSESAQSPQPPEPPKSPMPEKRRAPAPPQPPRQGATGRRAAKTQAPREDLAAISTDDSSVTALVDSLIRTAVERQASDIHIEPQEHTMSVRLRIDGALHAFKRISSDLKAAVAARIKVLAELDITERRLPQDGHFNVQDSAGRKVQFRVSTLPSLYGEKIVLRVLRSGKLRVKLDSLALSTKSKELLSGALKTSSGLILVTGPTGSGKTTTLYGMIDQLNDPHRNIVTVEDPVEYECDGVTQVQVNSEIGYTFERVLRSLLRQDPNVILVGEIRDAETATMALKAAVTGHMVLSTLHTNDAPSTLQRLISMGVPSYLVAAACRLVIAQRLMRRLCSNCRKQGELSTPEAALLTDEEKRWLSRVWRAQGCDQCMGIGYSSRQAVLEMMPITSNALRQAITEQASPEKLRELASAEGMRSLRQEALELVAAGVTSPEEAFTVLYAA